VTAVEAFAQFEATWRPQVEATLEALLPQGQGQVGQVEEGMRYAVLGGGKRLRALAVLAAAAAVGGEPAQALPAAAAVEVLHAYSLVHDDLPAMDNADQRRGSPASTRLSVRRRPSWWGMPSSPSLLSSWAASRPWRGSRRR